MGLGFRLFLEVSIVRATIGLFCYSSFLHGPKKKKEQLCHMIPYCQKRPKPNLGPAKDLRSVGNEKQIVKYYV
jgi:hypothetical protein